MWGFRERVDLVGMWLGGVKTDENLREKIKNRREWVRVGVLKERG